MTEFALRMMQSARPVGVGVPIGESASVVLEGSDGDEDDDDDVDGDGVDMYSDGLDASNAASAESALEEIRRSHGGSSTSTISTSSSSSTGSDAPAAHTYSELESLHVLLAHANAWIDPTEEAAATPVVGAAPGMVLVMRANHTAGIILWQQECSKRNSKSIANDHLIFAQVKNSIRKTPIAVFVNNVAKRLRRVCLFSFVWLSSTPLALIQFRGRSKSPRP
jgi:hypothetical protein